MKTRFNFFLSLTILYAILIFYLSSKSSLGDPRTILDMDILRNLIHFFEDSDLKFVLFPFAIFYRYPDKTMHMILYAGFGVLLFYTLKYSLNPVFRKQAFLFAIIIGFIYGASDEFHQSFVPGRSASMWDLAADVLGVTTAQTIIFIKDKICNRYKNSSQRSIRQDNFK
ncbi:MAG: VanZ family protein [Candidatus Methanoperedens sp.]|nr:VanZ family protein [Candidatus Methanoperedens sp.]